MYGDGRVYMRGKRYYIAYYADGKQKHEVVKHAKNKSDARKVLKLRRKEVEDGNYLEPKLKKLTVNDLLDSLLLKLSTKKASEDNISHYSENKQKRIKNETQKEKEKRLCSSLVSHLKHTRKEIGHIRADRLKEVDLDKLANKWIQEGSPNTTINRRIQPVVQAFNLGIRQKKIKETIYFTKLNEDSSIRQGFFEAEEYELMVSQFEEPYSDIIEFGYNCGWRIKEVLELKWENVHADGVIRLKNTQTKNKDTRSLPIWGDIEAIIQRRLDKRLYVKTWNKRKNGKRIKNPENEWYESEYVFHKNGCRVWDFGDKWREARKKVGLDDKNFHDFRRTTAKNLTDSGIPESLAMKITGHKTRAMFDRYNIKNDRDKAIALESLQTYRKNAGKEPQKAKIRKISIR